MRPLLACLRVALAAALASGCGAAARPAPVPESVRPDRGATGERVSVEIHGRFEPLVRTDFTDPAKSRLDVAFSAQLQPSEGGAPVALEEVRYDTGHLVAAVPGGLALGSYDLRVVGPDGAEGLLPSAYRSVTSAESVASFHVDAVGAQRTGQPFTVHATALDTVGRTVNGYDGPATVTDRTGASVSASFQRGRLRAELVFDAPRSGEALTVEDALGHRGESEPFDVLRGLAAALSLSPDAPGPLSAGACVGPLEVSLRDAWGRPPEMPEAQRVALQADEPGAAFFADLACSGPIDHVLLDPASGAALFYLQATSAGQATLRLAAEAVPSLTRVLAVQPAQAHRLALPGFAVLPEPEQCYPARVEVQDRFGNPVPAGAPLDLELQTFPGSGLDLFQDSACAGALQALQLGPDQPGVDLAFRASACGRYELTLAAPGSALLPASLSLLVQAP